MPRTLVYFLKYAVPIGIVVWLVVDVARNDPETFEQLRQHPKDWRLLAAAGLLSMFAVWLTFVRWWLLVRTLRMPFRLADAVRLSFLGYLLNFVSFGAVGGDLFKAVFIARRMPNRRPEAVATVVVDRIIGLYALVILTAVALLAAPPADPRPELVAVTRMTYVLTGLGGLLVMMVLTPGLTSGTVSDALGRLPKVGRMLERLIIAVRVYRRRPGILLAISALSLVVHATFSLALWLAAGSLLTFEAAPTLTEHLVIVPLAMVAGALPITPGGLGTFEYAMDYLYQHVPAAGPTQRQGLVIALAYRVITILIAAVGVVYYWAGRREVAAVLEEAQRQNQPDNQST